MPIIATLLAMFLLVNLVTFCVYWWDKEAARDGHRRIPEARLLQLAVIGGSLGALAAQRILRHKTHKEPFRTQLMAILILHAALIPTAMIFAPSLHHVLTAG